MQALWQSLAPAVPPRAPAATSLIRTVSAPSAFVLQQSSYTSRPLMSPLPCTVAEEAIGGGHSSGELPFMQQQPPSELGGLLPRWLQQHHEQQHQTQQSQPGSAPPSTSAPFALPPFASGDPGSQLASSPVSSPLAVVGAAGRMFNSFTLGSGGGHPAGATAAHRLRRGMLGPGSGAAGGRGGSSTSGSGGVGAFSGVLSAVGVGGGGGGAGAGSAGGTAGGGFPPHHASMGEGGVIAAALYTGNSPWMEASAPGPSGSPAAGQPLLLDPAAGGQSSGGGGGVGGPEDAGEHFSKRFRSSPGSEQPQSHQHQLLFPQPPQQQWLPLMPLLKPDPGAVTHPHTGHHQPQLQQQAGAPATAAGGVAGLGGGGGGGGGNTTFQFLQHLPVLRQEPGMQLPLSAPAAASAPFPFVSLDGAAVGDVVGSYAPPQLQHRAPHSHSHMPMPHLGHPMPPSQQQQQLLMLLHPDPPLLPPRGRHASLSRSGSAQAHAGPVPFLTGFVTGSPAGGEGVMLAAGAGTREAMSVGSGAASGGSGGVPAAASSDGSMCGGHHALMQPPGPQQAQMHQQQAQPQQAAAVAAAAGAAGLGPTAGQMLSAHVPQTRQARQGGRQQRQQQQQQQATPLQPNEMEVYGRQDADMSEAVAAAAATAGPASATRNRGGRRQARLEPPASAPAAGSTDAGAVSEEAECTRIVALVDEALMRPGGSRQLAPLRLPPPQLLAALPAAAGPAAALLGGGASSAAAVAEAAEGGGGHSAPDSAADGIGSRKRTGGGDTPPVAATAIEAQQSPAAAAAQQVVKVEADDGAADAAGGGDGEDGLSLLASRFRSRPGRTPKAITKLGPIAELAKDAARGRIQLAQPQLAQLVARVQTTLARVEQEQKEENRSRNRLSQQRFRDRQKATISALQSQVEDQEALIAQLRQRVRELEAAEGGAAGGGGGGGHDYWAGSGGGHGGDAGAALEYFGNDRF
ncbi:hypothetical protein HXX76_004065 [Chlamydomonas incerta]|uniref:BZIP domain-containing protein n=1 Tax=Chlamydomonas incerta TaxID=51695 RepID=A0A835W8M2_CHLIN|nr:hypothetical protein HXX76_004065 [Chlamydomonas incerta]|eukprot:KAG2439946.1 hypothetical protein HXX76_004065 [Chlamydomonas incerta]